MKKYFVFFLIGATLLTAGCAGADSDKPEDLVELEKKISKKKDEIKELQTELADLEAQKEELYPSLKDFKAIEVDTIQLKEFATYYEVQGVAESKKNITISSETNGMVRDIPVNEGQVVSQGQLLISVDADVLLKNIDEVKTSLDLAKTAFERQENLWKQNIGSEFQYLEAKNRKESLENRLSSLYAQYQKSNVRSPITGTVDAIYAKEGEIVMPGARLIRVVNTADMTVKADVSESKIGTVKKGDTVTVIFPSLSQYEERGIVTSVGQVINPGNRTFSIEVSLPNKNNMVKPNLLSKIIIEDYRVDSAIVISSNLVQQDRLGNEFIYLVRKEQDDLLAEKKMIKTSKSYKGKARVIEGLEIGDVIITAGSKDVSDKELVKIR